MVRLAALVLANPSLDGQPDAIEALIEQMQCR
jgi:hypothetical protein